MCREGKIYKRHVEIPNLDQIIPENEETNSGTHIHLCKRVIYPSLELGECERLAHAGGRFRRAELREVSVHGRQGRACNDRTWPDIDQRVRVVMGYRSVDVTNVTSHSSLALSVKGRHKQK